MTDKRYVHKDRHHWITSSITCWVSFRLGANQVHCMSWVRCWTQGGSVTEISDGKTPFYLSWNPRPATCCTMTWTDVFIKLVHLVLQEILMLHSQLCKVKYVHPLVILFNWISPSGDQQRAIFFFMIANQYFQDVPLSLFISQIGLKKSLQ